MLAILVLVLVLAGCASPEPEREGVASAEVCRRLAELEAGADRDAPLAEQNRETARRLLELAPLARRAADPDLAALGDRLELHARSVLDRLEPDASDTHARLIAEPMLRETVQLHTGCLRELSEPGG